MRLRPTRPRLSMAAGVFVCGLLVTSSARAWPDQRYEIEATLEPGPHRVRGRERITFSNTSVQPLEDLYFHLYLNAFASDETVFMRESGGALRGVASEGTGGIDVLSLRTSEGHDLLSGAEREIVPGDGTEMRVPLPRPLPPGASMTLEIEFVSRLPPLFARAGYVGSFHAVAQWYPKLAKLEPDGRWARFPYHGHGEFYADFATYELTVRAPAEYVVGGTGRGHPPRREGTMSVHRYDASPVHDVAFVAWPHFIAHRSRVGDVDLIVLAPPGHTLAARAHRAIVEAGLARFGALFGKYPYPTLTVVVPPRAAAGAAAMEYPTLFFTAVGWIPTPGIAVGHAEEVTAHELAHQWFQGMIANDEVTWPMLDEGLSTWAAADLLRTRFGRHRSAIAAFGLTIDVFELLRAYGMRRPGSLVPGRRAHDYRSASEYGRAVYARPALVLETVRRTFGVARFERALGEYARRERFRHPTPRALFAAFDREYGKGFSRRVLEPALLDGEHASVRLDAMPTSSGTRAIVGAREGAVTIPVHVAIRPHDGPARTVVWTGSEREVHVGTSRTLAAAEIDPSHSNLLDPSVLDNGHGEASPASPPRALFARALGIVQLLLGALLP